MSRPLRIAILAGIGALSLSFSGSAASARGFIGATPAVHLTEAGVISYAQLIERLQRQSYSDIKVTPYRPNVINPRPEQVSSLRVTGDDAKTTAVHWGWNGTAVKDGQTVDVYVDRVLPAASAGR
jgi:hypothetical protein